MVLVLEATVKTALFIKVLLFSGLFGNLYGVNGWYISLIPGIHVQAK